MNAPELSRFRGVAYRAIGGLKPLWSSPNPVPGRFNRAQRQADTRPTQYLCLHPMGPMAEFIRHVPVAARDPSAVRRNLFVLQLDLDNVLTVGFETAGSLGIAAADLVADDHDACRDWIDGLLATRPAIRGLRVPSAALPGTENLIIFGACAPISFTAIPRRPRYLPTAVAGMAAHPHQRLIGAVRLPGSMHPGLVAWSRREPSRLSQADPT